MGLDVWFREDVVRNLSAVTRATARGDRANLTADECILLAAICDSFGLKLADVLPPERQAAQGAEGEGDREA